MLLRLATLNLLSDLTHWKERSPILVSGLAAVGADILALQEVNLEINTAAWLAEKLSYPYMYLTPKTGKEGKKEGIAILSRNPLENQTDFDLESQNRVAQFVRVHMEGWVFGVANGHFYWQPGDSKGRLCQVQRFLDWLKPFQEKYPVMACGDFNAGPQDTAVSQMQARFDSAFAVVHGHEPDYTYPTPLPRSKLSMLHTLLNFWREIHLRDIRFDWHSTLDYIFVDPRVRVLDCNIILDQPAPGNPKWYASDHFGLLAVLGQT
jgi:endonuclease/exonuclease/phosphatase family metal-dependent hydrolase